MPFLRFDKKSGPKTSVWVAKICESKNDHNGNFATPKLHLFDQNSNIFWHFQKLATLENGNLVTKH
jgi:hypothetical protein